MPSIGVSVYYRQSSKILRILRSFNLVVRCVSRELCFEEGVWVVSSLDPITVAAADTDLEYWIHLCAFRGGLAATSCGAMKMRLGMDGLK